MKMQHLMASQQGVQDLEEFQFRAGGRRLPLFHSWDTKAFGEFSWHYFEQVGGGGVHVTKSILKLVHMWNVLKTSLLISLKSLSFLMTAALEPEMLLFFPLLWTHF